MGAEAGPLWVFAFEMAPPDGPQNGPMFCKKSTSGYHKKTIPQAKSTWQWNNFLEAQARPGQMVVHINMDETAVRLCPNVPPGAVAVGREKTKKETLETEQKANLAARRSALTFICFVCDDMTVQRALPQVIIGNEKVLPKSALDILNENRTDKMFFMRLKSSWVNQKGIARIVMLLGACLAEFRRTHFFILSMDACPCHCTGLVARACAKAGVHLLYVSASMTSVMQPCDTHVFAKLKRLIAQQVELKRLASGTGEATTLQIAQTLCESVSTILYGTSWLRAFAHAGLRDRQRNLSRGFLRKLQWAEAPVISAELPSLEQLKHVYRARSQIPIRAVFHSLIFRNFACFSNERLFTECKLTPILHYGITIRFVANVTQLKVIASNTNDLIIYEGIYIYIYISFKHYTEYEIA